ncbi:serine protease [Colwelliaceae bacterium 6471]
MKGFLVLLLMSLSCSLSATEQAEEIFKQLAPSLYQIKLIDQASGEKSSIGSGFQISSDGLIATNYHVISGYARHPKKYKIEYLDHLGNKGALELKSVDVINDLALVKRQTDAEMPFFPIADTPPKKGEEIYSLGNPHDLGMIVVPGTYNGLKSESFNDRIHFTGSVNPGMSGGPVVNTNTEVVGINVATSGNSIGFLVPHDKLQSLYQTYKLSPPENIDTQMAMQLSQNQDKLISTILNSSWEMKHLGQGVIPTIDVPFIRCWGESNADKPDALILAAVANCSLEENTYISSNFFTGSLEMEFRYMKAKNINDTKFYHLYEKHISRAGAGNKAGKEDVSEYQCHHDIVSPVDNNIRSKTIFCTRAYKDFNQLFDVLYLSASVDKDEHAIVSHFTIAGVKQDTALTFTKKFMESVSWK